MSRGIAAILVIGLAAAAGAAMQIRGSTPAAQVQDGPTLKGMRVGGGAFDLGQLHGRPAALVFVRGTGCPLCMQRLRALERRVGAYDRLGAAVVALTPDPPEIARHAARALDGELAIVSVDTSTLRAWGMLPTPSATPLPGEFVLAEDGALLFAHRGVSAADYVGDVELLGVLRDHIAERAAAR